MRRLFTLFVVLALLAGCAHNSNVGTAPKNSAGTGSEGELKDISSFRLSDPEGPKVVDQELESIPTEVNPLVEKWIAYFQGRGRPHMERYLARSTRYEKLMKKVLRDNGLPEDLFYIALIESGFSSKATSHASAVGYWQFIRGTGKRYGLEISAFVDERRDPVFATQAAAEYFKGLYSVFGSWYLAMASYNVGENRVKREVMNHYTRDFWELARKKRLPKETINYVPKFIAAKMIGKDPAKYGFDDIDYLPPIEFDHITVAKSVNLRQMSEKLNLNYEDFKALNPKFKGEIATLKGSELVLRIPPGTSETALVAANESFVDNVQFVADSGDTQVYRIRRGDTLSTVARRYRTTVAYLRDLNDISRRKALRVGMRIYVPDRTPLKERSSLRTSTVAKKSAPAVTVSSDGRYYIVQSGDSLFTIARKYSTSVSELQRLNAIKRGRTLKVGMKIKIPSPDNNSSAREVSKSKVHVVRRGENLSEIAAKYKVSLSDIKQKNKIRNPASLVVGSRITIPTEMNQ
ncbi:LysM peptidoglycan-binding domain-containing protein [Bdellovibrio reynosensis]|uniref:LysM peptidoglycan-binding domain-containing protein n=1 Tax=Bdellovibrio reynosensis TaxID=2835041 RepID=A0ABY4CD70_9BACT|nr:LysM peptidoglycan-binding domain-containing protein [Bdellovibrio reynosensis]UOF02734.1 LysM peptidoglycan-binding domain-containing protein [Bdellovibrio reynosensis]